MSGQKAKAEEIKGTTISSVLSRLFRRMLVYVAGRYDVTAENIDNIQVDSSEFMRDHIWSSKYDQLMHRYLLDARNCIPRNRKEQSSARGNLQKELLKSDMSWKVFMKGLRFLEVLSIDISITLTHSDGKKSTHSTSVNLGNRIELADELDQPRHNSIGYFSTTPGNLDKLREDIERATNIIKNSNSNIQ
jgi:hypothetical protein